MVGFEKFLLGSHLKNILNMFKNFFIIVNKNAHQVSQQVSERNLGKLNLKGFQCLTVRLHSFWTF